ncbi:DNA replication/repair protein RecF [Pannus brasiliensis CCIBt3594]|uniref:DNA replication and repair protein RecF n=1 Tax=Pannus brasiliensis CCIBt3594 TaxID=1427578 RepID=A0AAW9QH30_9CHRO
MYLEYLHLQRFRNYEDQTVKFEARKTILVGDNARGKSNLLEAIELLATLKSHRVSKDRDLVLEGEAEARIFARVARAYGTSELSLLLRASGRRTVIRDREPLRRHLDFLGVLNAVQFSSLDLELVRGGPETRRDWLDTLLIQLEPLYSHILGQYNQVLRQRNALLKEIRKKETEGESPADLFDSLSQLALWDSQLAETGSRVTRRRARVLERLTPLAKRWHESISGKTEELEIRYAPNVPWESDDPIHVQKAFLERIESRRMAERQLGASVVGPHRDDVEFSIDNTPARSYGSQGQQRTLVLALKLAELQLLEEIIGEPPLLLLDDVLAELDLHRQNQLLDAIEDRFQTLITTTHLSSFDARWLQSSRVLTVEKGRIVV